MVVSGTPQLLFRYPAHRMDSDGGQDQVPEVAKICGISYSSFAHLMAGKSARCLANQLLNITLDKYRLLGFPSSQLEEEQVSTLWLRKLAELTVAAGRAAYPASKRGAHFTEK